MVRIKWLVILLLWQGVALGQTNRYMVFFTDKDTAQFSTTPAIHYLSERAIQRRENQNIDITIEDFPVKSEFINRLNSIGAQVFFTSRWKNSALVEMDQSLVSTLAALSFVSKVDYIAKDTRLIRTPSPSKAPTSFQAPVDVSASSDLQLQMLNAHKMHEDGFKGEGKLIAIFDDGFEGVNQFTPFQSVWEENRLIATRDFIRNSDSVFQYDDHGTRVFSTIAAEYETVFSGTAPKSSYVLCVTEDIKSEYRIEEYNWLLAAEFADSIGADVINASVGYSTFSDSEMNYTPADLDGQTSVVTQAANLASSKGMIVVVSAGNEGRTTNSWRYITSPADAFDVLAVGSVNGLYRKSDFSSVGPTVDGRIKPDVCALGSSTAVISGNGFITIGNGTSFASPIMAGFAAAIWQANPTWTSLQVMTAIRQSASNSLKPDSLTGYGIPNYELAVTGSTLSVAEIFSDEIKVYPNPFSNNKFTIDLRDFSLSGTTSIKVINTEGKRVFSDRINGSNKPDQLEITLDTMESGVFFLILENRNISKTVKLVKI